MIDFREIQVVDNTFELTNTIAQNEELTKNNKHLFYLVLASTLVLIVASLYFSKKNYTEDSKDKMS
ncbi:hypothetical protein [Flavivirga rizhaonensis]|uniref:Uncharacterized protein n=1 Tax=Flavivirga rizhaonensis TaxID=2559571 RepID=A0A4S1DZ29_9FLAO|nr:hypothetical protein [Flavivirga rizhaonensis]TGV03399.1 hypothetical protein EM932_06920 [Flavivirga rizhaonensis]